MHLTIETQAAYAEGTLSPADAKAAHQHLLVCAACAGGVADQLAIMYAMSHLPTPPMEGDGWEAIADSLGTDWHMAEPDEATKIRRPLLPTRRHRWVAAAVMTVGLASAITFSFVQPAPADDEIDSFWREHHSFSSNNNLGGRHLSSYRSMESTHDLNTP